MSNRTFWRHTEKAIQKAGAPADRIYAVVGIDEDGEFIAWKCIELPNGKLKHPGFDEPLSMDSELIWLESCENGAMPTALFKPDSFYRKV